MGRQEGPGGLEGSGDMLENTLSHDALRFKGDQGQFLDWIVERSEVRALLESLDYRPGDSSFFVSAITHTSFAHEFPHLVFGHSERLEFLGDAFVDLYFSKRLFSLFPDWREGKLSRFRSALVNRDSLSSLARFMGLPRVLLLGKGEVAKRAFESASLQADVFEALVGAVLMEQGESQTLGLLDRLLGAWKEKYGRDFIDLELLEEFDAKSRLQEICVQLYGQTPRYHSREQTTGTFKVSVFLEGKELAEITRSSKRRAEKELAELVLKRELYSKAGG